MPLTAMRLPWHRKGRVVDAHDQHTAWGKDGNQLSEQNATGERAITRQLGSKRGDSSESGANGTLAGC